MKANKNVFPYKLRDDSGINTVYTGLNVRDYIAIQAMTALLTKSSEVDVIADMAYKQADAMIKRSEK